MVLNVTPRHTDLLIKHRKNKRKKKRFCDRETLSYHTLIFSLTIINKNFTHSRLKH